MRDHAGQTRERPFPPARPSAASAVVQHDNWCYATDVALETIMDGRDTPPDLVILFASSDFAAHYPDLVREVHGRTGTGCLIGTSSRGAIAGRESHECEPALSMIAFWLPGAVLTPVRLHQEMLDTIDADDAPQFPAVDETKGWILFADPYRMDAQDALQRMRSRYAGVPFVGALASTMAQDRRVWVFLDDHVYDEGGVALAIAGPYTLQVAISQGAAPVGQPWTITGVERNRITTISNRPALDVLNDVVAAYPDGERDRVRQNLMLGFPMSEYHDAFYRGDFVVRGLLGVDEERGELIVGSIPRCGQTVQFQLRDAAGSSLDTQQALVDARAMLGDGEAVGGLLCTCRGRGRTMFGRPDHDARAVQSVFRDLPVAGMFSIGEIGPVMGVPALNGFAMAFGVIVHEG